MRKADMCAATHSLLRSRECSRRSRPRRAAAAGTKLPSCARYTIRPARTPCSEFEGAEGQQMCYTVLKVNDN